MNKNRLSRIRIVLFALLATSLQTACTEVEIAEQSVALPEGMYPLEITSVTLSVEGGEAQPWGAHSPQTRVSENTDGTSSVFMGNDAITVSLGGETAAYTYDGNAWTSTAPLYWQSTQTATVNAWYPANGSVNLADQSQGLAYVLKGTGKGSYQSGVNLIFTHQLAKVRVELMGEKASDVTQVEIYSYTTCTHSQGTISTDGASQDWITMHQADYNGTKYWEANVVPGTITQDKFIRLNGSSEATVTGITDLTAGTMYTVNLNVEAEDPGYTIDRDGNYQVYTAKGLQAWASHVNQRNWDTDCTLAADITLTGTNNWTPVGTNFNAYTGTFDGAGHTISGMVISGGTHTQGFIGHLSGTVKNLTITGAKVSGSSNTIGGIVGKADNGSNIIGCAFSGTVSGIVSVGGIVGDSQNSNITACWSTAEVTASLLYNAGCIVGSGDGQNAYTACYWGNTTTTTGIGGGTEEDGIIHVDNSSKTWDSAMEAMNSALANAGYTGYRWGINEGSDKEDVPLVLVRQ